MNAIIEIMQNHISFSACHRKCCTLQWPGWDSQRLQRPHLLFDSMLCILKRWYWPLLLIFREYWNMHIGKTLLLFYISLSKKKKMKMKMMKSDLIEAKPLFCCMWTSPHLWWLHFHTLIKINIRICITLLELFTHQSKELNSVFPTISMSTVEKMSAPTTNICSLSQVKMSVVLKAYSL